MPKRRLVIADCCHRKRDKAACDITAERDALLAACRIALRWMIALADSNGMLGAAAVNILADPAVAAVLPLVEEKP